MDYYLALKNGFWKDSHWFPPGANWSTLSGPEYPNFYDLKLPIFYAFIVLAVRTAFERSVARPLGRAFGIKEEKRNNEIPNLFNRILNRFRPKSQNGSKLIRLVAHKSKLDKFSECCWRFVYYFGVFIYGLVVLRNKPWFTDTLSCWYGFPFQSVPSEIWLYYMIELSFYWSLIFSQFVDVKRKDFWVFFIHHIAAVLLMSFSWAVNFVRVGTLVLVLHDAADFWLETCKMAKYCGKDNLSVALFAVFGIIWFVTRCFIYPFWIIHSTLIEAPALIIWYSTAYLLFNFLLLLLLIMHILWSIMIVKIAIVAARIGGEADDARSDSEDDE